MEAHLQPPRRRRPVPLARLAAGAALAAVLAVVFASYLDPHFAADLARRAWSCL